VGIEMWKNLPKGKFPGMMNDYRYYPDWWFSEKQILIQTCGIL
jgi:hypothetical protein